MNPPEKCFRCPKPALFNTSGTKEDFFYGQACKGHVLDMIRLLPQGKSMTIERVRGW